MVDKKVHCILAVVAGVIALLADITGSIGLYGPLLTYATNYAPAEYASIKIDVICFATGLFNFSPSQFIELVKSAVNLNCDKAF